MLPYMLIHNNQCSHLVLIHTKHFCTQYFDKKIKRHLIKRYFFLQNIVMTFLNILKRGFIKQNCPPNKYFQYTLENR